MCPLLKIANYYVNIDKGEIDRVLMLFSSKITYKRGDLEIEGKEKIEKFYRNDRIIKKGIHIIKYMINYQNLVLVEGVFQGELKSGEVANESFFDEFHFKEDEVIFRKSSFLNGKNL